VDLVSFILLIELKSNRDHYQGQNEASKSAHSHSIRATFEMPYKLKKYLKKFEIFTTSTYAVLASILKISTQNFDF
jgi:hypothetical protein